MLAAVVAGFSANAARGHEAAPGGCELHVWPSGELNSVYQGWIHGGIVNGAVTGRDGYPEVPPDPLGAASQTELLDRAQPQGIIGLHSYRLIVHPQPLTSREIRTTPGRLTTDGAPCYAELIVDDVFLQQDVFFGSQLKSSLRYRDFGDGVAPAVTPVRVFGTWVKTPLKLFPPKEGVDRKAASDDLKSAYVANLTRFAEALNKPAKGKRGK
ncbi:hypothetical protein [Sphingomonas psychrotolerans]|uniref:Uncharacterized protein n=1 Tax=Sphingomonas psychrotolerans TaxID=1327635 RepID=A0A2K8MA69_9SPHN|nr:hypothetical protein [Sphingomonas psychrotolerans]ATY30773.1 hypothetical protein CVN68_01155 [Sphingomonas psychrotolerans]